MPRSFQNPFPAAAKQMAALGQRLKLARQRRQISSVLFAERVGVSRDTLHRLEKGDATVALGTYVRALRVLGLDGDVDAIARDDVLGRKLQDLQLPRRTRPTPDPEAQALGAARGAGAKQAHRRARGVGKASDRGPD